MNDRTADFRIQPFDPSRHDRSTFSCGVAKVDNFVRQTAGKLSRAGNTRLFMMTSPTGELIGFYALNAGAVDYRDLPRRFARDRPSHGTIPAAFIAMIGVDSRFQGSGYGGDLLVDCLTRIVDASDALGIAVILLDVLDCGNDRQIERRRALYLDFGFEPLASAPLRLFMSAERARRFLAQER